jgi:hypothetical protein
VPWLSHSLAQYTTLLSLSLPLSLSLSPLRGHRTTKGSKSRNNSFSKLSYFRRLSHWPCRPTVHSSGSHHAVWVRDIAGAHLSHVVMQLGLTATHRRTNELRSRFAAVANLPRARVLHVIFCGVYCFCGADSRPSSLAHSALPQDHHFGFFCSRFLLGVSGPVPPSSRPFHATLLRPRR